MNRTASLHNARTDGERRESGDGFVAGKRSPFSEAWRTGDRVVRQW